MEMKTKRLLTGTSFSHGICFLLRNGYNISIPGLRLGGAEVRDLDELLQQAVDVAKEADCVIAVVGLNAEWESEGYDRTTLALPGRTDELIAKLAAVNSKTVVVTQAVCNVLSRRHIFDELFLEGLCNTDALGQFSTCNRACLVPWKCVW
jgi:hypothetical protein